MSEMTMDDLRLDLLGSPAAAGLARTLLGQRLRRWGHAALLDDVLLVASELVTNAAEATPGEQIRLRLGRNEKGVFLGVWDSSPLRPYAKPVLFLTGEDLDATDETFDHGGGWGLPIVRALATACGVQHDDRGGKWVWATFDAQA